LSATGFDRERNVFNAAALAVDTDDPLLVVEGTFDALPYWPDVVALLGKPSEGQIGLLLTACRPLVVALDGDAWLESEMLAARLELDGARATWLKLPPKRDPGDLEPARVVAAARRAVDKGVVTELRG
jgi:DNA primase